MHSSDYRPLAGFTPSERPTYAGGLVRNIQIPTALLLYLQSAPHNKILAALEGDCQARDMEWYTPKAQELAAEVFLHHPAAAKHPPRSTTLRSVLKQYITRIEQPHITGRILEQIMDSKDEAEAGSLDPIRLELMETYIGLRGTDHATMTYKTYYNIYVELEKGLLAAAAALQQQQQRLAQQMHLNSHPRHGRVLSGDIGTEDGSGSVSPASYSVQPLSPLLSADEASAFTFGGRPRPPGHHFNTGNNSNNNNNSSNNNNPNQLNFAAAATGSLESPPAFLAAPLDLQSSLLVPTPPDTLQGGGGGSRSGSVSAIRRNRSPRRVVVTDVGEAPPEYRCLYTVDSKELYVPVRVTAGQFTNVGLALWPAAAVMVQLLAQELMHSAPQRLLLPLCFPDGVPAAAPQDETEKLHVVELGAGAGLTPLLLHRLRCYRELVSFAVLTDYQQEILDNLAENLRANDVSTVSDFKAAAMGLEGEDKLCKTMHTTALLDWREREVAEGLLSSWGADLILAADCIYDVDCIPDLVETIRLGLSVDDRVDNFVAFSKTKVRRRRSFADGPLSPPSGAGSAERREGIDGLRSPPPPARAGSPLAAGRLRAATVPAGALPPPPPPPPLDINPSGGGGPGHSPRPMPALACLDGSLPESLQNDGGNSPSCRGGHNNTNPNTNTTNNNNNSNSMSGSRTTNPGATPRRPRTCLVVQTHRQNSTMKKFFDAVRRFARVTSYSVVKAPFEELQPFTDSTRTVTGAPLVTPLGEWEGPLLRTPAAGQDPRRTVCGLCEDTVLPDGALLSSLVMNSNSSNYGSGGGGGGEASLSFGKAEGNPLQKYSHGGGSADQLAGTWGPEHSAGGGGVGNSNNNTFGGKGLSVELNSGRARRDSAMSAGEFPAPSPPRHGGGNNHNNINNSNAPLSGSAVVYPRFGSPSPSQATSPRYSSNTNNNSSAPVLPPILSASFSSMGAHGLRGAGGGVPSPRAGIFGSSSNNNPLFPAAASGSNQNNSINGSAGEGNNNTFAFQSSESGDSGHHGFPTFSATDDNNNNNNNNNNNTMGGAGLLSLRDLHALLRKYSSADALANDKGSANNNTTNNSNNNNSISNTASANFLNSLMGAGGGGRAGGSATASLDGSYLGFSGNGSILSGGGLGSTASASGVNTSLSGTESTLHDDVFGPFFGVLSGGGVVGVHIIQLAPPPPPNASNGGVNNKVPGAASTTTTSAAAAAPLGNSESGGADAPAAAGASATTSAR